MDIEINMLAGIALGIIVAVMIFFVVNCLLQIPVGGYSC